MGAYWIDWLSLLGRWTHVVVGIAWIGASFYFVWLDNHLLVPNDKTLTDKGVGGELWAVHGGGFYNPQKYKLAPAQLPGTLHWFYWEAYSTWLSGFFLLCLLYYRAPALYLIDPRVYALTPSAAIAIGLASLFGGWGIYHALCQSPLARNNGALSAVLGTLLAAAAWGLCHVFSGRGAFLHFGALLGTIMAANVFFVIIPGQRQMVADIKAGRVPSPIHGQRGKQRSVHNTYFTLPVLLVMISNHYAMTYGSGYNWLALIGLTIAGATIRVWFVNRHKAHERGGRTAPTPLLIGLIALALVAWLLKPAPVVATSSATQPPAAQFQQVLAIVAERCAVCHAEHPRFAGFSAPPKGVMLDTPERVLEHAAAMQVQLASGAMPVGNLTQMNDAERSQMLAWIAAGAPH
jgi:uncharacterized membrane protein